jgi:polyhydroxyalkanoate synthesis regulator phasin
MDKNTKDILETVNFIKDRMLTKDDVRDITREVIRQEVPAMIRAELKPIHHELKEINRRLDTLDEEYKNLKGVTKEIDELRDQVRAIEKHLGLDKKIAA